ncbi:hypothetical protein B0J11DRAFT_113572 [Dendryphion nanum]|uniref:Uncharacterized protein n=1 Tax=Dendryphion nanum TaxID=256645 RepID=A0A9P9DB57_9PLEO|nr:hypothetical protein B0J11DRAFT_113572 [Dendryphion nanum]
MEFCLAFLSSLAARLVVIFLFSASWSICSEIKPYSSLVDDGRLISCADESRNRMSMRLEARQIDPRMPALRFPRRTHLRNPSLQRASLPTLSVLLFSCRFRKPTIDAAPMVLCSGTGLFPRFSSERNA